MQDVIAALLEPPWRIPRLGEGECRVQGCSQSWTCLLAFGVVPAIACAAQDRSRAPDLRRWMSYFIRESLPPTRSNLGLRPSVYDFDSCVQQSRQMSGELDQFCQFRATSANSEANSASFGRTRPIGVMFDKLRANSANSGRLRRNSGGVEQSVGEFDLLRRISDQHSHRFEFAAGSRLQLWPASIFAGAAPRIVANKTAGAHGIGAAYGIGTFLGSRFCLQYVVHLRSASSGAAADQWSQGWRRRSRGPEAPWSGAGCDPRGRAAASLFVVFVARRAIPDRSSRTACARSGHPAPPNCEDPSQPGWLLARPGKL